ncbi:flagellar biosynthetic protein FliQ [Pukyongiella litopenaei]|uniref:Flagellar biosynthetic protein FliQ n=1 Tax=Pukyongiella litopenaei TaxID=2605946 RepID=A0A2S0MRS1_9RHOB|nr:flagellar biosynthetic protein FliQ [Pukyongiella litopenaei]AVO38546.1 flagellar biosynthetic protein FliQ [Pukyongiella litopenaei]
MLSESLFYDTLRQGMWSAVMMSTPVLTVALVTGLVIGLFQALTSIQEMTLTFVPKLAAIVIVFWATMGYMTQMLLAFFDGHVIPAIAGGT